MHARQVMFRRLPYLCKFGETLKGWPRMTGPWPGSLRKARADAALLAAILVTVSVAATMARADKVLRCVVMVNSC